MKKYNLAKLCIISLFTAFTAIFVTTKQTKAQFTDITNGAIDTGNAIGFETLKGDFASKWTTYAGGMLTLLGALFLVLVIYGGFLWMTAAGKEEQVEKGKKKIVQASIGLGIVFGARLMVEFFLQIFGTFY